MVPTEMLASTASNTKIDAPAESRGGMLALHLEGRLPEVRVELSLALPSQQPAPSLARIREYNPTSQALPDGGGGTWGSLQRSESNGQTFVKSSQNNQ